MIYDDSDDDLDDEEYDEFGHGFGDEDESDSDIEDDSDQQNDSKDNDELKSTEVSNESPEKLQNASKIAKIVPFRDQLERNRIQLWSNLKEHLCSAIVTQGKELEDWISACDQYYTAFGCAFTKREHILLIELLYKTLTSLEHDFALMRKLTTLLSKLLKNTSLLTRDDLQLDWRPLFSLYHLVSYSGHVHKCTLLVENQTVTDLTVLVSHARAYFPREATREMLTEWRQYVCIYSKKFDRYLYLFMLFLPTIGPPEEHEDGFKLWFEDFMQLWIALPNLDASSHHIFFLHIFCSLSQNAFGYVDWEPYLPVILQRLKKRFNSETVTNLEMSMSAQWLAYLIFPKSSLTVSALKQYFKFKFYNHKSLCCHLIHRFIQRLKIERWKRKKLWWLAHVPKSCLLTDEIISEFAAFMTEQFERISFVDFELEHLYHLSLISTEAMSKQMIEKFVVAEERIFEPARLQLALQLFSVSLFPLITNELFGEKHKVHIIPVLSKLLKSINTNDQVLASLHLFAIRSIVVLGLPFEDCSGFIKTKENLDENQIQILRDSALLVDFPLDFVKLCFTIMECNNEDLLRMTQKDHSVKTIIFEILIHIFVTLPEERFKILADEIINYSTTSIIENTDACDVLEKMISACLKVDQYDYVFEKLFYAISANIISAIDDQQKYSDICQSEFVYNWRLLQACFGPDGSKGLVKCHADIIDLLNTIYQIDFENNFEHSHLITDMLSFLFFELTGVYLVIVELRPKDLADPEFAFNRFMNFPIRFKEQDLPLLWHVPSTEEIDFAKALYSTFIKPEMVLLERWANKDDKDEITPAQVEKSLGIVLSFLGCVHCIPNYFDNCEKSKYFNMSDIFSIDLFDGANFRYDLVVLMGKVAARLSKDESSDNVTLIMLIIEVIDYCIFAFKLQEDATPAKGRTFNLFKNILKKETASLPIVQYYQITKYQTKISGILEKWSNLTFTETHNVSRDILLQLSTCDSSNIRNEAQSLLMDMLDIFPLSFEPIIPKLLANLKLYDTQYDLFKGTLYLIYGSDVESVLLSRDWKLALELWPALVMVNYAEKPKIADLFDNWIIPLFSEHYYMIPIEITKIAAKVDRLFPQAKELGFTVASKEEFDRIEQIIDEDNLANRRIYEQLIQKLMNILDSHKLHWRFYELGFIMLSILIRYDSAVSPEMMELFLQNLIHDLSHIRSIALRGFKKMLFLLKPKRILEKIENSEHTFKPMPVCDVMKSKESFEGTVFFDKMHDGYADGIPKLKVLIERRDYSKYQFIVDKFRDDKFLDKYFHLHSIETSETSLRINTVKMWKFFGQIFTLFNLDLVLPRIENLLKKDKHNFDKLAMEILSGMIKSTPFIEDYDQLMKLNDFLREIVFAKHLVKFGNESYTYFQSLFQACFSSRDVRRFLWVFEGLFTEKLFTDSYGPYTQAAILNFTSSAIVVNYRYPEMFKQAMDTLEKNLSHKYKFIRQSIAFILSVIFPDKIGIGHSPSHSTVLAKPDCFAFVDRLKERLDQHLAPLFATLHDDDKGQMATVKSDLFDSDKPEGQELQNLVDTISSWVVECSSSKRVTNSFGFERLLPHLLLVQSTKQELQANVQRAISKISVQIYSPSVLETILADIQKMSKNWNWHTRLDTDVFLHTLVYNNLMQLRQRPEWLETVIGLVLNSLRDEVIEVRAGSSNTLRDFIKWDVIEDSAKDRLMKEFKLDASSSSADIVIRHSGILGLGAFVYAYISEMPDFIPNILIFLSKHVSDPQPIQGTATQVLRWFKRTHEPYWIDHKKKFSEQQLIELSNVLISSSCFA